MHLGTDELQMTTVCRFPFVLRTYYLSQATNKYTAGQWKRSTVTHGQMDFLTAFHDWTRGERGIGAVIGKLSSLVGDKRRYYPQE